MSDLVKGFGIVLIVVILLVIIGFVVDAMVLDWTSYIGPKRENIRREIYEETKSYNEGKEQDLVRYRLQYLQADTEDKKAALASTIRMMFADYDYEKLNPELQEFLKSILYGGFNILE